MSSHPRVLQVYEEYNGNLIVDDVDECDECGALVTDSLRHDMFHESLKGDHR